METEWIELSQPVTYEQSIKKSTFIAYAYPVFNEEDAKDIIKSLRKQHPKAVHACSAMIIDEIERSNDDGEPSSSAGLPILSVLRGLNLNHTLCVVIRYFGGTLLGVGGLIQAYTSSAQGAFEKATFKQPVLIHNYQTQFPYGMINPVEALLSTSATITDRIYEESVIYHFNSTQDNLEPLLIEATNGQAETKRINQFIIMKEM